MPDSPGKRKRLAHNKRQWAEETRKKLVKLFPACFVGKGQSKPPLKIGIYHDIRQRAPEIPARQLSAALFDYTRGATYQKNLIEGAFRIDLDGAPAGEVTAHEAQIARVVLEGHRPVAALHSYIMRLEEENVSLRAALEKAHVAA